MAQVRALRPGGRVVITDVTVTEAGLPEELTTLAAWAEAVLHYTALAKQAVADGLLGYALLIALLIAEKP